MEQSVAVLQIKRDGTPINTTEFVLPSFNNRLTLVNDGSKTYFIDSVADNEASNADFGISDGSAKDKLEWKNALLKWTGRAGSDEAIKRMQRQKVIVSLIEFVPLIQLTQVKMSAIWAIF